MQMSRSGDHPFGGVRYMVELTLVDCVFAVSSFRGLTPSLLYTCR